MAVPSKPNNVGFQVWDNLIHSLLNQEQLFADSFIWIASSTFLRIGISEIALKLGGRKLFREKPLQLCDKI